MKTSTPTNDFNKPIPESEPFPSTPAAQKGVKVSTRRPIQIFPSIFFKHSAHFYDRMISHLIAEVQRG